MKFYQLPILFLLLAGSGPLQAHHAMEFIELESYNTAPQGAFVFHLHYDYLVDDRDQPKLDHWELTPGLSYGITNRLMVDIHSHFAKFGNDHVFHPKLTQELEIMSVDSDTSFTVFAGTAPVKVPLTLFTPDKSERSLIMDREGKSRFSPNQAGLYVLICHFRRQTASYSIYIGE